ncbi:MAG: hypothetical protein MJ118_04090 [Clostridia bacterium]|nr:hypothetical protein [Clostridia bacterium]
MKKRGKIILCVLSVLVLVLAAAAFWQRGNIKALRYGMQMSSESLEQQMESSRKVMDDAMEEYHIAPHAFSEDELAALADGSLSIESAAELLCEEPEQEASAPEEPVQNAESPAQQTAPSETEKPADAPAPQQPAGNTPAAPSLDDQIQQCVAQMYVLQATYEGKLDALVQSVIDEYASGELTQERKQQVIAGRVSEALALESECDTQVSEIVSKLRTLLSEAGKDDTLAVQIEQTYQEQKSLKKAQYLKQYRGE